MNRFTWTWHLPTFLILMHGSGWNRLLLTGKFRRQMHHFLTRRQLLIFERKPALDKQKRDQSVRRSRRVKGISSRLSPRGLMCKNRSSVVFSKFRSRIPSLHHCWQSFHCNCSPITWSFCGEVMWTSQGILPSR